MTTKTKTTTMGHSKRSFSSDSESEDAKPTLKSCGARVEEDRKTSMMPTKKKAKKITESPSKRAAWTSDEDIRVIKEVLGDTMPTLRSESVKKLAKELGRSEAAIKIRWCTAIKQRLFGSSDS
ncbi:hypothetical protein FA10DRAFT_300419 [Acaromyces ingoldii]|uniref:Myb-like domain-containing protein n=1 Tax=Acaromyces ingoldii TaxID=215250 RepID=A0A316YUX5_9BASI|nr:hypothetical protein FA10DRAFT_300419 [Acaromyces ingoldii]PWN91843.1 hypothetical protein FA10DRAFT_300419 [Acaromyces ingoldii]